MPTHLKYPQWVCKPRMMWNHWKHFEKMTEDWYISCLGGHKWLENRASEAHIHTFKSASNGHADQDWCETSGKKSEKINKNQNFDLFFVQNVLRMGHLRPIFYTPLKLEIMFVTKFWTITHMHVFTPFHRHYATVWVTYGTGSRRVGKCLLSFHFRVCHNHHLSHYTYCRHLLVDSWSF